MMNSVTETVPGSFDDFPSSEDVIPRAVFVSRFAVLAVAHVFSLPGIYGLARSSMFRCVWRFMLS